MKRFNFFTIFFLLIFLTVNQSFSQQVNKNYVVVEIGTGTWCTYCPGAAMGADDLVENGHDVAIIENHNGDSYANTGSNARNSYYNITGYPTAFFNGGDEVVGGSHSASLYPTYLPIYNNAIAVMSDFTTDMNFTHIGLDYDVTIDITEPGDFTGTNLAVHLVLTESHIPENWQGMTEVNFVSRAMYPDENGTAYSGGTTTVNLSFTADAGWDLSNCELVAFIQDNDTKEIVQADKETLAEPTGTNNVALIEIHEISDLCEAAVTPSLKIKNFGASDITSLTINYNINSGATTGTYNWSGDAIPFNHYAQIDMDEITFSLLTVNTLDIDITQVNGNSDDDPANNTGSTEFNEVPQSTNIVNMELNTDGYGSECTWDIRNSSGTILFSGGPYSNYETINEQFFLDLDYCNSFNIYDSYGDGGGSITLEDSEGTLIYFTDGNYGIGESQYFATVTVALPEVTFDPADGATNVDYSTELILTFNQPMRNIDDSEITNSDIPDFVSLTDPSKGSISFTAVINAEKTEITITPDSYLPELEDITVTIAGNEIESTLDDALALSSATFTTGSYPEANVVFYPADGALNINIGTEISLTFDQAMRMLDDSEITNGDISSFVSLTDPSKADIAFTGTINTEKTFIALDPDENLPELTDITVTITADLIENEFGKSLGESSATFTTEDAEGISEIFSDVNIYPNPAKNIVFISNAKHSTVILTDISGKTVLRQVINSDSGEIDINNLTSGLYILKLELNGYSSERKLIIVK